MMGKTNWSVLTPNQIVQRLGELSPPNHLKVCNESVAEIKAEVNLGGLEIESRLKILITADWQNTPRTLEQLQNIVTLKAELYVFSQYLSESLWNSFDQCISRMAYATGYNENSLNILNSTIKNTPLLPQVIQSSLQHSVALGGEMNDLFKYLKSNKNFEMGQVRYFEAILAKMTRAIDNKHPTFHLVQTMNGIVRAERQAKTKQTSISQMEVEQNDLPMVTFDISCNGFSPATNCIEASIIKSNPRSSQVMLNEHLKKSLPLFTRVKNAKQHYNFIQFQCSRNIEIHEFSKGQFTLPNTSVKNATRITQKFIKRTGIKSMYVWGNDEYTSSISAIARKLNTQVIVIPERHLALIKTKLESTCFKDEQENITQIQPTSGSNNSKSISSSLLMPRQQDRQARAYITHSDSLLNH